MRRPCVQRRGFVLLAVLWVMVGIAVLGVGMDVVGRDSVAAAQNRVTLIREQWTAEGCIAVARSTLSRALESTDSVDAIWEVADTVLARDPELRGCTLVARPVGVTIDVNTATAAELTRFFQAASIPSARADSLTAALMDWRDPDDVPTPGGAETAWYTAEGMPSPRNGQLRSPLELPYVRGFAQLFREHPDLIAAMGVDPIPVDVNRAPLPVIAALPDSSVVTTSSVGAWVLTVVVRNALHGAASSLEVTVARAGTRVAILRQRRWP